MKKNSKRLLALLLASVMTLSLVACGGEDSSNGNDGSSAVSTDGTSDVTTEDGAEEMQVVEFVGDYTYQDSVSTMTTNWNPHTYQTTDDAYLADFIRSGLYTFIFNDELNAIEGKDNYAGYVIIPEMAASEPVDVTEQVKAEHPEFNIPESATSGYAYTIDLNPACVWEDGTPINADSYVYSMQQLLDSSKLNYRASDYYSGNFVIAGAENYANSGNTTKTAISVDGDAKTYEFSTLVKNADGQYTTPDGALVFFGLTTGYGWMGGYSLDDYSGYIAEDVWTALNEAADEDGFAPVTDDTIATLYQFTGSDIWGNESQDELVYYMSYDVTYDTYDYSTVGLYKSGDYQITLVLAQALSGFNLLYNLSGNWLVNQELYDACAKYDGDVYSTTYNTSVETTKSYGPYKLVSFQKDKALRLEKNENWWGWTDGKHVYVDPVDGLTYPMYQTTAIDCEVVAEAATRKMMFLKGELMGYGLQSEDFATYRNSDYVYVTPSETIFFLIFNGHKEAIANREKSEGFDQTKNDLETMTLNSFRRAFAVTYDKELFASTVSPARSGGYGLIGNSYLYDPETGSRYRDTDQAKMALCEFYSVDVSQYATLDEAVDSITGYDPVKAKELFTQAYNESIAAGYITDTDGDGISDQTIEIEYCMSSDSEFMTTTINYLNEKLSEVITGTPFEGKIKVIKSALYGNDWSNKIREGLADTVLAGWSGSALNPFSLTDLYTNPDNQYDGAWFDATTVSMTKTIGGKEITMNLKQWSDALNGTMVTVDGVDYNFGEGMADIEDRLEILAAIETEVLKTYNYIPMLQNASMSLLSQQVYYVVEEYNPVMGRGGIAYLKYNYNDTEWVEYVASQGGELSY